MGRCKNKKVRICKCKIITLGNKTQHRITQQIKDRLEEEITII